MELLARYLKAVRAHLSGLPPAQQEDVIEELSTNILAQAEERESELGRPLSETEQATLLKRIGNPALVAGRYWQDPGSLAVGRQWIGPALFPLYARILRFNLGLTLAVCLVIADALGKPLPEVAPSILLHLLLQFGILTLVFTVAQSYLTRFPDRWDPGNPLSGTSSRSEG